MQKFFCGLLAMLVIATAAPSGHATETQFGPLVSADQLANLRLTEAPFILDIRGNAVKDGYIPGAISVGYGAFRGPSTNPGQLVTDAHLTTLFRKLGVMADKPTVVVYQGKNETDFGAAARVYWTLKSAGIKHIAILNGGMNAWIKDANRQVSASPATPQASMIDVTLRKKWLATRNDVLAVVKGDDDARLIDARPVSFYRGKKQHPAAARPGTLPKSDYFLHSKWFVGGASIIDASAAQSLASSNGFKKDESLVSFCNTGHWAATNWFALSELGGVEEVKLYPESMVGWSHANLPMDNTPGLLENLMDKIKR
ncbi:MAG: rhodanese-like domain-containing protein [Rhodospirillales bacterium]|nr:rhodanese-like domain-containing protein [Rhodospirillales bacterium]